MSKELEVINRLEALIGYEWLGLEPWLKNELPILKVALKRNEPVKVDSSTYYGGLGYFKCPKCGETLMEGYYNYCPDCGQKLKWSDEEFI